MRVAYIRVSTVDQNDERQRVALSKYDIEKWFSEKVSGKNMKRQKLQEMLNFVREGDEVYIHDFSRIARSTKDLLAIVEFLEDKKVKLVSIKENIDTHTPSGRLMLTMIGAIAEFERQNLLERQREGIAIAKAEGKYKGGKEKEVDTVKLHRLYERYIIRDISKTEMAKKMDVSRPTLDKYIKLYVENDDEKNDIKKEAFKKWADTIYTNLKDS